MKNIFYLIFLFLVSCSGFSQDVIYQKSTTDSILTKIIEVNVDNIKYRKHSNLNGPIYTINKSELIKIVYSNGDIEHYNQEKLKEFATVYIIRPKKMGARLNGMTIYENEKIIGVLSANTYLSWKIEANNGEVIISSKGEGTDVLRINPKVGKTYYIKQGHKTGWIKARPKIEFIDEKEANKLLKKAKKAESKIAE
jgi:hypothetical protein